MMNSCNGILDFSPRVVANAIDDIYAAIVDAKPIPVRAQQPVTFVCTRDESPASASPVASPGLPWHLLQPSEQAWGHNALATFAYELNCHSPLILWRKLGTHRILTIGFVRPCEQTPLSLEEHEFLSQIEPHIQRATETSRQLQKRDLHARRVEQILDRHSDGIVVVQSDCTINFANHAAESLFDSLDSGLSRRQGKLSVASSPCSRLLRQTLIALRAPVQDSIRSVELPIRSPSSDHPFRVVVSAVSGSPWPHTIGESGFAVVSIADPNRQIGSILSWIKDAYRLTPKEAQVATALAEGLTLEETSKRLSNRPQTCRSHLKSIFGKMGVSRQGELVRVLALASSGLQ